MAFLLISSDDVVCMDEDGLGAMFYKPFGLEEVQGPIGELLEGQNIDFKLVWRSLPLLHLKNCVEDLGM